MCEPTMMGIIGAGLGIAQGAAKANATAEAERKNIRNAKRQYQQDVQQEQREFLVNADAAITDAHDAKLQADRYKSLAIATSPHGGTSASERVADQAMQGAINAEKALDREEAAGANYAANTHGDWTRTNNYIETEKTPASTHFFDIAASGLSGYSKFRSI